jgi:hypothetical protein
MSGLIIAGWFPSYRPRKAAPAPVIETRRCDFCHQAFEWSGRRDRKRRTCRVLCAAALRRQAKEARARVRFQAARAARWLSFPKREAFDV